MTTINPQPAASESQCDCCGSDVTEGESYWTEGYNNVCRSCYDDIVKTCQLCGADDVMPSQVSEFILVKAELADTATRLPGIYRIMHRPFLSIPIIGGGSLNGSDVAFVDRLPKPDAAYDISGHVCRRCARPYARKYRRTYGGISQRLQKRGSRWVDRMFERERTRVASVARRHPEMLRDLEDDAEYSIKRLCEVWNLPDVQTWNEWLLLEHKGVKVYKIYEGDSYGDGWLTLRPEPKYRNDRCSEPGVIFCASGLPTYPSYPHEEMSQNYPEGYLSTYDWDRKHSIPAIIAAIDQGLLTQTGVRNGRGEPVECR